jgi:small-conductance mechanosensitive channel
MNNELTGALGRLGDVYRQLGTREPTNAIEAQAVIENIRAEKGYLDEETLQDLQNLSEQSRDRLLRIVKLKRETEAAYTTKYDGSTVDVNVD